MKPARGLPSIRSRLSGALLMWSLVWALAVGTSVWVSAAHEVDELLDDALQASADLMLALVRSNGDASGEAGAKLPTDRPAAVATTAESAGRYAWQVVRPDRALHSRSPGAPATAWHSAPRPGFSDVTGWRLYGLAVGDGRMLYLAQSGLERREAYTEVALGALLSALAVGLLGLLWLRARVAAELQPLQALSAQLAAWELQDGRAVLALDEPRRAELRPVHEALELLAARLAARVASEQAFSAHAAHALRTPLAGIDAQLAVALRESPPALRERLQSVRDAATRLQSVTASLLQLFRSGGELVRVDVDLQALLARLPAPGLRVQVVDSAISLRADADLLAAALMNLLDNARRHGASQVRLHSLPGNVLRFDDDGPGVTAQRLDALREALTLPDYGQAGGQSRGLGLGLGLTLADRVARAHGGRLVLPVAASGFIADLVLQPDNAAAPAAQADLEEST